MLLRVELLVRLHPERAGTGAVDRLVSTLQEGGAACAILS
jgi:hypothetical protein